MPKYHTQFIAISGIVEFRSNDPTRLPTTTTKRHSFDATQCALSQVKMHSHSLDLHATTRPLAGRQFRPILPAPLPRAPHTATVEFARPLKEIQTVAEYLLGDEDATPAKVGEACFDAFLREAAR